MKIKIVKLPSRKKIIKVNIKKKAWEEYIEQ